jgi:hypothetical protein
MLNPICDILVPHLPCTILQNSTYYEIRKSQTTWGCQQTNKSHCKCNKQFVFQIRFLINFNMNYFLHKYIVNIIYKHVV